MLFSSWFYLRNFHPDGIPEGTVPAIKLRVNFIYLSYGFTQAYELYHKRCYFASIFLIFLLIFSAFFHKNSGFSIENPASDGGCGTDPALCLPK
jgi:hypothetical protein